MKINLLFTTPLYLVANATRHSHSNHYLSDSWSIIRDDTKCTCPICGSKVELQENSILRCTNKECFKWFLADKHIGKKDFNLVKRVGFKYKHESVLEHAVFEFDIRGISRAVLQELARHRIASLTVKSTRYTLKELLRILPENEEPFLPDGSVNSKIYDSIDQYFVIPPKEFFKDDADLSVYRNNIAHSIAIIIYFLRRNYSIDKIKEAIVESLKVDLHWTINLRSLLNFLKLRYSKEAYWGIRNMAQGILNEIKEKEPLYYELIKEEIKEDKES